MGDRRSLLKKAVSELGKTVKGLQASSLYETAPWGNEDQPPFLNLCVVGQTDLLPEELLKLTNSIESSLGRTGREKWGPREIDIDILFYDDLAIDMPDLEVPHPHIAERAFVLVPLAEIDPDFIHPILKKPVSELRNDVSDTGISKAGRL